MADYDGSIRINTNVDNSDLKKLQKEFDSIEKKLEKCYEKGEKLEALGVDKQSRQWKSLLYDTAQYEAKLEDVRERIQQVNELKLDDVEERIARYYKGYTKMQFGEKPDEKYIPAVQTGALWGWQFTSSGSVDGINGNVDMNIAYYDIKETEVKAEYYQTPEFTLIDSLNKVGVDSSFKNRALIAAGNGICSYTGSREQNLLLLELLNTGKLIKA